MSSTYHLDLLAWHGTSHVCAASRREQGGVTELVDALLPCFLSLFCGDDGFVAGAVGEFDCILDPASLDFDRRGTVRE